MNAKKMMISLIAFVAFSSQASTSITISALANCLAAPPSTTDEGGTTASVQLEPGRYVLSLVSNNMSCSNGTLSGGCLIDTVMVQGGWGTSRWGKTVTAQPVVVDYTAASTLSAYVYDQGCYNNTGQATLLIEKAQ